MSQNLEQLKRERPEEYLRTLVVQEPGKALRELRPRVLRIMDEVNHIVLERESEILAVMLSLLSGTDGAIVGEGGIAKSQMMRNILGKKPGEGRIAGAHAYMTVLNSGVRPQDLWSRGVGVQKVDHGDGRTDVNYEPRTDSRGADPRVRAIYVDEFSMGSEMTQESVRAALSDREAHVMGAVLDLGHVWSVWVTTNALPKGPLNWRLVCKLEVQEVVQESNQLKMMVASDLRKRLARFKKRGYPDDVLDELYLEVLTLWSDDPEMVEYVERLYQILQNPTRVDLETFEFLKDLVFRVSVPPTVKRGQVEIRRELQTRGIHIDARRFVRTIPMVKAHAALVRGSLTAGVEDLVVMQHAWADPGEARAFREVVFGHANPIAAESEKLVDQAIIAAENAIQSGDVGNGRMAIKKIKVEIIPGFAELITKAEDQGLPVADIKTAQQRAHEQIARVSNELLGTDF